MNKNISMSISKRLLARIEQEIEGSSRSQKICKCAAKGYEILNGEKTECPKPLRV